MRSRVLDKVLRAALLMCVLCSPALQAQTPGTLSGSPALLQDLSFGGSSDQTNIALRANRAFDYTSYYPNPRLFILDITDAQSRLEKNYIDVKTSQVDFASVSQIGEGPKPMVRIEFNLARAIQYSLKPEGNRLFLTFRSLAPALPETASQTAKVVEPAKVAEALPNATASQPREVTLREDSEQIELVLPTAGKPSFKHFLLKTPNRLVVDVSDSVYKVTRQAVKLDSDLIRRIRFGFGDTEQGKLVRCVFDLSRETQYAIEAADNGIVIRLQKEQKEKAVAAAPQKPAVLPQALPALPELPVGPVSVANDASTGLLDSFLRAEMKQLVVPEPAASVRSTLPVLEEELNVAEVAPRDKRSDTRLLAMEIQLAQPLPPSRVSRPAEIQIAHLTPAPTSFAFTEPEAEVPAAEAHPQNTALMGAPAKLEAGPAVSEARQEPVPPEVVEQRVSPPPIQIAAAQASVPQAQQVANDAQPSAALSPVARSAAAQPQSPVAPPSVVLPALAPVVVQAVTPQTGNQVISAAPQVEIPKYSGEPLSLELKDADLKDFFRLIGEISGLNIVLDPDVKGVLTIFLNEVPWDQALDVVLRNNSLGKQLDGNVLRIASNATLEGEETQRKRLADARVVAAELQTETRVLSYAKAAELSLVLKKVLSTRGDIIVDSRTNAMIIQDIPEKFPAIDALIRQLDKKIKQVEIEARVIAATRDFLRDIGVQIGAIYGNNDKNTVSGAIPGNPFTRNPPPNVTMQPGASGGAPNALPLISNLGANAPSSAISFFAGVADNFLLDTIITAAERRGNAKLLSKPKIITQDNIEGFVQQGVKIPVQTTINNTVSVQFFDFSLKLTVTPQITDEGTIVLKVDVENSTPDFSRQVQGVPTVNTQQTKTTVLVNNGGTVVIGGVLIDSEQTNLRQVPGIGNIPLIGNLFKNRSVTKQTQELIFFLSPKIL